MKKPSLLLVGYGRFGSFAAELLRSRFTIHILERRGPGPTGPGLRRAVLSDLGAFDFIVLALPAPRLEKFLMSNGRRFRDGAFVADVCAVKMAPMKWLKSHLPRSVSYAGLHPLFGPDSASSGYQGQSVAVCRGRSSPSCHRRLLTTIRAMGLKPVETDPITHDKSMASSLFLTQFIGEIFPSASGSRISPVTTATFEHLRIIASRAARNSPALIGELYQFNPYSRKSLRILVRQFQRKLGQLRIGRTNN